MKLADRLSRLDELLSEEAIQPNVHNSERLANRLGDSQDVHTEHKSG